jgi:hypothetical protein
MLRLTLVFQLNVKMFRVATFEGSQDRTIITRFSHSEYFSETTFVVQLCQLLTTEAAKGTRVDPLNFEIGVDYPDPRGKRINNRL